MNSTFSPYVQASLTIIISIVMFVFAFILPEVVVVTVLILIIPFQLIDSYYGSFNMAITYILGMAFLMNKRIKKFPLIVPVSLILFSYFLSLSQIETSLYFDNIIYLVSISSNFILFYIVYNFLVNTEKYTYFFMLLILLNVFVVIYSFLQMQFGFSSHEFLDIGELTIKGSKELYAAGNQILERRLRGGPFASEAMNSEYMAIQILIFGYLLIFEEKNLKKFFLISLICIDYFILIGTGNRGSFFSLFLGSGVLFILFYKEIGLKKIIAGFFMFSGIFVIIFIITVLFTPYDSIFIRLQKTEVIEGVPDTRQNVWEISSEAIKEKPILGWGPKLQKLALGKFKEKHRDTKTFDYSEIPSPHSLYLFLLYTIGMVGLIAYLIFFGLIYFNFFKSLKLQCNDQFLKGLPKLGILVLSVFLFDQIKLEFLRVKLADYQHYIFMLLGAFMAFSEIIKNKKNTLQS